MRIIYLGTPAFAIAPLHALVNAGYEVVAVITQPDKPAGRNRLLTPPPVKVAAQELGLEVLQPFNLRDPAVLEHITSLQPDVGVVAAYGEILRKAMLRIPPLGYLNIHPSLLPLYRGPAPVAGAILAGDSQTGVTIMKLDAGMDSGPILGQVTVPLPHDARTPAITEMLFQRGAEIVSDLLRQYADGTIEPQPQDDSRAVITRMLSKGDGLIDWTAPASVIERRVRAYDPWPGTYTSWYGQQVKVLAASVTSDTSSTAAPGTIVATKTSLLVATGEGILDLVELQPAGKRTMTGREWLAGHQNVSGQMFGA